MILQQLSGTRKGDRFLGQQVDKKLYGYVSLKSWPVSDSRSLKKQEKHQDAGKRGIVDPRLGNVTKAVID